VIFKNIDFIKLNSFSHSNIHMRLQIFLWLKTNQRIFLLTSILNLMLLALIHFLVSSIHLEPYGPIFNFLHGLTIILVASLSLIVITKGIVAFAINSLGMVLIYGSIVIPSFELAMVGQVYYKAAIGNITENSLYSGSHGLFLLGLSMIIFSVIIGYRPTILYTKNRPAPMEAFWSKYPIWEKGLQWAAIKNGSLVMLHLLMNDKDRYLLWRYAYVLVLINDTLFLVPVNSFVPSNSMLIRDDVSGKLVGVDKYMGYFA
jgi:hypothetical protein